MRGPNRAGVSCHSAAERLKVENEAEPTHQHHRSQGQFQRLEIAVSAKAACLVAGVGFEPTTFGL